MRSLAISPDRDAARQQLLDLLLGDVVHSLMSELADQETHEHDDESAPRGAVRPLLDRPAAADIDL